MQADTQIKAQAILQQFVANARPDGLGKLILLSSAHSGSGTSYVARQIAIAAAAHFLPYGQRVLLLDYDIHKQSHLQSLMSRGHVHGPYDATFNVAPFWQIYEGVQPNMRQVSGAAHNSLYIDSTSELAVTAFRWDQVSPSQNVMIMPSAPYWAELRRRFALIIIDGPALDRSPLSSDLFAYMDMNAIISTPQNSTSAQTMQMVQNIQNGSGKFSGLILNKTGQG